MNKRNLTITIIGVPLVVLLVALILAISAISKKRAQIVELNNDLKNRDAKLSQLENQIESLNAEKSSLAGVKLSLEAKLNSLEQEIGDAKEKEADLNKKLGVFSEGKKKLENDLAQTTQLMQDKLKSLEQESKKELARKSKQYLSQKKEFAFQIEELSQKLKSLNEERNTLEKNALRAAEVTARLMKEKEKLDHYKLGLSYENKQDYQAAVKEYEAILEIDPQDANIYLRLASIYIYSIKDPERADFYAKGYAVLNRQKENDGEQDTRTSLSKAVDEKIALTEKLNEAEQKLTQKDKQRHAQPGDLGEMFGTYREKALKRHYNLAIIYENAGRYREAAQEYEKTLELSPDDADIHYNLAIVYDDFLQDNEKAIFHYRRYLELSPNPVDSGIVAEWIVEAKEELDWQRKIR
ncbi:MAG: tetratricopeptide repeat protein [Candidatus Omnitrophica bacterium]|jgi:tetratricopeptide (TPR) repeat protein|nr:tetratricopeptide repeat protein [Candidatus Omnitrophota bacterium]